MSASQTNAAMNPPQKKSAYIKGKYRLFMMAFPFLVLAFVFSFDPSANPPAMNPLTIFIVILDRSRNLHHIVID